MPRAEDTPGGGGQARLIASGSLVQQLTQVTGLLALLAIVTVLARRLSLSEFGVYGLLTSLAGYLLVIQNSAASAGVRSMAAAVTQPERDGAFSTAALVYTAAGVVTGALVALVGLVLAEAVDLPADLRSDARAGSLAIGAVIAVGWPITVWRDALRARQLFVPTALVEMASLVVYAGLVLGLAFADASLAVLIAASGTIPLLAGIGCTVLARVTHAPFHFTRAGVTRERLRDFAHLAFYVSLAEAAGTIIYAMDRVILGLFRNAATVGLYEGPVRAHNVVRALNAAVTTTVLPSASRYVGEGDKRRLAELLVRGVRYTLALAVPITVTGMVLAPQILEVWLGPEFREAGLAMAILMSYWLLNGCNGVLQGILVAAGRAKVLARYAWVVAVSNLALSLALTPWLGLEGVVIGTAVPYICAFPILLRVVLAETGVEGSDLLRQGFMPAWVLGAALAAALGVLRVIAELDTVLTVAAAIVAGGALYWAAFYSLVLSAEERALVRDVARGFVPGA